MNFQVESIENVDADVLAAPVLGEEALTALVASETGKAMGGAGIARFAKGRGFIGAVGSALEWPLPDGFGATSLALIGCGAEASPEDIRRNLGTASRRARNVGAGRVAISADGLTALQLAAAVEGACLGGWVFTRRLGTLKRDTVKPAATISVFSTGELGDDVRKAAERAETVADAVGRARDLVSEPANVLNPATMAEEAERVAEAHGLDITVLRPTDLERLGAGAILGVGQGSDIEPCLIHLVYRPEGDVSGPPVGIVGKCITFDTGGYSIKTNDGMVTMKSDMAGGAAVLAAM
ncbi:MAG: leucyl aminopeptidase, partial [Chloroflexota bacterium]|nr:leucyl aminopeptidase [Chloroflexota bacterium]